MKTYEPSPASDPFPRMGLPVKLAERLVRMFGVPGCTVLDPFAGTGATGPAALRLGAGAVLVDNPGWSAIARKRCEAVLTAREAG